MNEDFTFRSFSHIDEECYPVVCLPIIANGDGGDNASFFGNLRKQQLPSRGRSVEKVQSQSDEGQSRTELYRGNSQISPYITRTQTIHGGHKALQIAALYRSLGMKRWMR